ncbi:hypothetical protein NHF46_00345 [Arthrobacter alpinus]|nr:hypothetical protein [Arthrobacter sp. N199823]MDD0856653.1 hypothetical protein [Arthrobacter alpinus]
MTLDLAAVGMFAAINFDDVEAFLRTLSVHPDKGPPAHDTSTAEPSPDS